MRENPADGEILEIKAAAGMRGWGIDHFRAPIGTSPRALKALIYHKAASCVARIRCGARGWAIIGGSPPSSNRLCRPWTSRPSCGAFSVGRNGRMRAGGRRRRGLGGGGGGGGRAEARRSALGARLSPIPNLAPLPPRVRHRLTLFAFDDHRRSSAACLGGGLGRPHDAPHHIIWRLPATSPKFRRSCWARFARSDRRGTRRLRRDRRRARADGAGAPPALSVSVAAALAEIGQREAVDRSGGQSRRRSQPRRSAPSSCVLVRRGVARSVADAPRGSLDAALGDRSRRTAKALSHFVAWLRLAQRRAGRAHRAVVERARRLVCVANRSHAGRDARFSAITCARMAAPDARRLLRAPSVG